MSADGVLATLTAVFSFIAAIFVFDNICTAPKRINCSGSWAWWPMALPQLPKR